MSERTALVLGGTGMLQGCADELVARGWRVVLPCRRARPELGQAARAALRRRGHTPIGDSCWVAADWARAQELAERVRAELDRPADLLVAWVHASYREPVLKAVEPLLAPGAPVVEVHDIGAISPTRGVPDPLLAAHPTQQVVLGFVRHAGQTRWLTHEEASKGVMEAVHRALEGKPPSVHQLGEVDTWVVRR
ncbi:hypothetical protein [Saccharothrix coeruleofusca]|uniref:Short-chain dehydrogenase n=1 Tax=Saccharothrix coeruleofusca TaxID=33919 RepID=A0A918ALY5_9PSEU|nr:hypothetical protein [Saccharothrix coeruleofusca]MBP2338146.1 NAD(P)-dependent dehydrogenase (short-subunit alcohol dehydrogenase family) [Saccharothrix coeruleofusca]GGP50461.1 short-chain dehydrogenase [Saccharothrix coeruleofusca]